MERLYSHCLPVCHLSLFSVQKRIVHKNQFENLKHCLCANGQKGSYGTPHHIVTAEHGAVEKGTEGNLVCHSRILQPATK